MKKRKQRIFLLFSALLILLGFVMSLSITNTQADEDMVWKGPVIESFEILNVEDGGSIYSDGRVEARVKMYAQEGAAID